MLSFLLSAFDAVIHFAGLKAVGESTAIPLRYYHNNIAGTLILCEVMQTRAGSRTWFSAPPPRSTASPEPVPIPRGFPRSATNPYGRTKLDDRRDLPRWAGCRSFPEHSPAALL